MKSKLFSIILILFLGCKPESSEVVNQQPEEVMVPVTTVVAERGDFHEFGEYYGRVQGVSRATIINFLGGTVEGVDVKEGDRVNSGDSLGKISSAQAELLLETAKLNEKISLDNYNTLKGFLKKGSTTPLNVDQAHLQYLASKKDRIEAEKAYEGSFCISPIDGLVVSRNIDVNEYIHQGYETFLIEDLSRVEINIGIPEEDMKGIKDGAEAEVTFDLYPGKSWKGILTRFSRRSSDMNLVFRAKIVVDNSDGFILSGTTAKVRLLKKSYIDTLIIPSDTVFNEFGENYVMVVNSGIVNKKRVSVLTSSINLCVIGEGIEGGEEIVQEGLHIVADSQSVEVKREG